MKANKLLLLVLFSTANAQAATVCKAYEKAGNFKIMQICAEDLGQGTYAAPRFIAESGAAYPVSTGKVNYPKGLFICKQLGFAYAILKSVQTTQCPTETPALNTKANTTFNSVYGSNDCLASVQCSDSGWN